MYEHGRGVALDRVQAKSWYEKAAGQGNVNAMHNLAVLHADGGSGERNYQMAASWFHKAAEHGLKDSQFNLAVLSEQGLGVARSPQDAVFWYSLAAVQGDSEAAKKAKELEAMLADDLAKQVHARLLAWRPLSADRNANVVPVGDPSWLETS
jgi:localization factor PodJL